MLKQASKNYRQFFYIGILTNIWVFRQGFYREKVNRNGRVRYKKNDIAA